MTRSFVLTVAVVFALASAAVAKPRIAIAPIDGDDDEEMADQLEAALDGSELDVTGTKSTARSLDKLNYDTDLTEKQAKKLSSALDVDAILIGTLGRKGVNKVLRFRMFVRGKKVRGFKVTFNNARSDRFKVMLREKLVDKIENADEESRDEDDEDKDDDEKDRDRDKDRDKDDEDEDEEEDEDGDGVRKSTARPAGRAAVRLDVGLSVQNRSLQFTSRQNNYPQAPNPYKNAPVPGARVEVELYPLAFSKPRSFAGGLGLAASFDRTLSLTLGTTEEPGVPVKATQQAWSVGGRIRIQFGAADLAPSMSIGADYGVRTFTTDRSGLMDPASLDLPDTQYKFVAGGVGFRFPLAKVVALGFGGRVLGVLDAGPIQQPDQYGQAKVYGGQGYAALDFTFGRFALKLAGEFSQFGFAFTGNGFMTNSRDGDPDTKDVGGAADRSIGGAATFGVLY